MSRTDMPIGEEKFQNLSQFFNIYSYTKTFNFTLTLNLPN